MLELLDVERVREARSRIAPYVLRTPLLEHPTGSGPTLYLKPEQLQSTGAFKIRGAFSLMSTLSRDIPGVVAHSSGNHAQAVARAARTLGLRAVVVMPRDAPVLKRSRTEADGAEVVEVGSDSGERVRMADSLAAERGLVPVPPYDHPLIAAGQGTLALEMIEDAPPLERFYCPVSGGGLMSGCAVVLGSLSPTTELVGVEPYDGHDTKLSLAAGRRVTVDPPRSLADGLRVRTPGVLTFPVLQRYVSRIELVTDEELLAAMRYALTELRMVLEPSGAAALAVALREGRGRVGVVLSGGNVDSALLRAAMDLSTRA